jgi:hypothetical protein
MHPKRLRRQHALEGNASIGCNAFVNQNLIHGFACDETLENPG